MFQELDHSISEPLNKPVVRVLSLGAGVQSSALLLMSERGELPRLDAAIFADTGWEPAVVYRWVEWLEDQTSIPIIRCTRPGPNLGDYVLQVANGERERAGSSLPPFHVKPGGVLPKQCNAEFKRDVVNREISRMCWERGHRPYGTPIVEQWLGMTTDELHRIGKNRRKYIHNRWPLIEMNMNRGDTETWFMHRQYPRAPKSACIFCPYIDNDRLRNMEPDDYSRACAFDAAIRHIVPEGSAFVHRSKIPLADVDLTTPNRDMFVEECLGYCNT